MQKLLKAAANCDNATPLDPTHVISPHTEPYHVPSSTALTVELYEDALLNTSFADQPVSVVITNATQYATIAQTSTFFGLNSKQHAAFVLFTTPLLYKIARSHGLDGSSQVLMDLGYRKQLMVAGHIHDQSAS